MGISIKTGASAMSYEGRNSGGNAKNISSTRNFRATVVDIFLFESQRESFFNELKDSTLPVGTIKFQRTYSPLILGSEFYYAVPKNLYNTIYPVVGEQVDIANDESYTAQTNSGAAVRVYQYSGAVPVWSSLEQNRVPKNSIVDNSANKLDANSYKESETGATNNSQGGNTVEAREVGNIKSLYPLTDHVLQGRVGNSIRLGMSDNTYSQIPWKGEYGNPILILRNGQREIPQNAADNIFEDINKDGSSIYMMINQTIDFAVACTNFESYNLDIDNVVKSQIVEVKKEVVAVEESPEQVDAAVPEQEPVAEAPKPVAQPSTPTPAPAQAEELPENEDDLIVQDLQNEPVPITNGILNSLGFSPPIGKINGGYVATTKTAENLPDYVQKTNTRLSDFAGKITASSLTPAVKAYLDLIAIMEGTAGRGDFNGYDTYFKYKKVFNNYTGADNIPPHPNVRIPFQYTDQNGVKQKNYSTAAGRYQFLYSSWLGVNGGVNAPMTRTNQDVAAYKRMLKNVSAADIENSVNDYDTFIKVVGGRNKKGDVKCLAAIWASLPSTYYGKTGAYGQNVKHGRSFEELWARYQQILTTYKK